MKRTHDKKTLANEYCLCRDIPHRWVGNNGQLVIGDNTTGREVIFSIYNIPFKEIVSTIDRICEYDAGGWYCGLKEKPKVGRPAIKYPTNWDSVYGQWKAKEITAKEAIELTAMKRTSFYKLVKRAEKQL